MVKSNRKLGGTAGTAPRIIAKLSHDDIRSALWRVLDESYPYGDNAGVMMWPSIIDVYDDFLLARLNGPQGWGVYRLGYDTAGDTLTLDGEPKYLSAQQQQGVHGALRLSASGKVVSGTEAQELLADLVEKNPLFAAIQNSPNTHFVVFDLTTVGRASQHAGKFKYKLATDGLGPALPTLISKPIHVTAGLDGHIDAGEAFKPIGAFLGGVGIDNEDGTKTVRAIGTLWESDFPDEVEEISKQASKLGASYEIQYNALHASRVAPDLIEISAYQFSGGALLKKTAAAHPETQVLVARNRRPFVVGTTATPPARAARAQRGSAMGTPKSLDMFSSIPEDLHAAVQALIDRALADRDSSESLTELQAANAKLTVEINEKTASIAQIVQDHAGVVATHASAVAQLEKAVADATSERESMRVELAAAQEQLGKVELDATIEKEWAKLAAAHGFTDAQKAEKLPILKKIVAGEKVTLEETAALHTGGKGSNVVPLFAGGGNGTASADPKEIAQRFPGVVPRVR